MPVRPFKRDAHRAALLLVQAITERRVRATEAILKRPDIDAVAMECARLAAYTGRAAFKSNAAFLENLRHAVTALDEAASKPGKPTPNGKRPES